MTRQPVVLRCRGRELDPAGMPAGQPCDRTYASRLHGATPSDVEAGARAAGWKLGPVLADGDRDVMCDQCGRPDREIGRILRGAL